MGARRERRESARWLRPCAPRPALLAWPRVLSALQPPTRATPGFTEPGEPGEDREREARGGTPWPGPCPAPCAVASSGTGSPGRLRSPRSGWRTQWLGPGRARVVGGVTTDRVIWSPWQAEAQDEALEGSGPGVAHLQLPAICLDVPGGSALGPPPGTRACPATTPSTHPGRPHRPPGPVSRSAPGRPRRGGASRTFSLGCPHPGTAPSSGSPASAGAAGGSALWAARARGARERAGPGLHVG